MNDVPRRRAGFYYINDKQYVSVTTALKVINKPFLFNWAIKKAAEFALQDPSLDPKEVGTLVRQITKDGAERGTSVHAVAEEWAKSKVIPVPHGLYAPYIKGLVGFIETHSPEPIASEIEVYSDTHGYAGTADLICKMNGLTWLLDVKTNQHGNIYSEVVLQLRAYQEAIHELGLAKIDRTGVVVCDADGGFTFRETHADLEDFLHVKKVFEWSKKKNILE